MNSRTSGRAASRSSSEVDADLRGVGRVELREPASILTTLNVSIFCGLPSSRHANSSCFRSRTALPSLVA